MKLRFSIWIVALALAASACQTSSDAPPVILISVDSLRADAVGCYGYQGKTTPLIDLLAQKGAVFTHAWSNAPWPQPAYASIFTGAYPSAHRVVEEGAFVNPDLPTLAALLKERGYKTAGIVGNPALVKERGYARGFEQYYSLPGANAEKVVERAIKWLDSNRKDKFFLFLEFDDPQPPFAPPTTFVMKHYPPQAPPIHGGVLEIAGFMEKWPSPEARVGVQALRALYDAEIDYVDDALGNLYKKLQAKKLDRKAVIVVTSSGGEEFMEHGLLGHGYSLYDEQIRVPLIFYGRGRIRDGYVADENVSLVDLMPTILDLAGAKPPENLPGRTLLPLMSVSPEAKAPEMSKTFADRAILAETTKAGPDRLCVIRGAMKYICSPDYKINGRAFGRRLFDLARDPEEKTDLLAASPDLAAPFERAIADSGLYQRRRLWTVLFGNVKKPVVFSGLISTSGGFIALGKHNVVFGPEQERLVSKDFVLAGQDKAIRFAAVGQEDVNGFRFLVDPPGALIRATLLMDGRKNPAAVAVGAAGEHPREVPFSLETRYDGLPKRSAAGYAAASEEVWVSITQAGRMDASEAFPPSVEFISRMRGLVKTSDKSLEETLKMYTRGQGEKPSEP